MFRALFGVSRLQLSRPTAADVQTANIIKGTYSSNYNNKHKYFSAMKSTYALEIWLNFHILRMSNSTQLSLMFSDVDVTKTCLFPEQAEDKVRNRLSGRKPKTANKDYEFFTCYSAKSDTAVHSDNIQE
jgi:hypothetical protein